MFLKDFEECLPGWVRSKPDGPEPLIACHCLLSRNLADFVFPRHCSNDERAAVESRIVDALGAVRDSSGGRYFSAADLNVTGIRVLAERYLTPYRLLDASGPRGVFVFHDQNVSVTVNLADHVLIRASSAGDASRAWALADTLDSALAGVLQYAFHERLGYLTSSLNRVGTGMRIGVLLHLPALNILGEMEKTGMPGPGTGLALRGMALGAVPSHGQPPLPALPRGCPTTEVEPASYQCLCLDTPGGGQSGRCATVGNLFVLVNRDTLGLSERELAAEVGQGAAMLVQAEQECRERLLREHRTVFLDSVGRALGIARNAQCLGMGESLALASMIRLADALGLTAGCDRTALTGMLMTCQQAHLQCFRGVESDPLALASERAGMFRSLFAAVELN